LNASFSAGRAASGRDRRRALCRDAGMRNWRFCSAATPV